MKLKNLVLLAFSFPLLLSSCSGAVDPKNVSTPSLDGYDLLWADEFNGDELDETKWTNQIGDGSPNTGWGNNEAEFYTKDNSVVMDGNLVISAIKERKSNYNYTSARLYTRGLFSFNYGRIEASIKLPAVQGMWPAFWMLPEDESKYGSWPHGGEIDIMEARGRVDDMTSSAVHYATLSGTHAYQTKTKVLRSGEGTIDEYHVYALEWEEGEMRFFVDDSNYFTLDSSKWTCDTSSSAEAPFDNDFYIILNLAVGGNFDGGNLPPEDFESADMLVDYVRVYQKKGE